MTEIAPAPNKANILKLLLIPARLAMRNLHSTIVKRYISVKVALPGVKRLNVHSSFLPDSLVMGIDTHRM